MRLKLLSFWPWAGGRGTMGSPPSLVTVLILTHHGLNTSWCPLPLLCAANKIPCYMNLTQQTTGHLLCQCPHIDVRLPSQVRRRGKGKYMVWRDEHKDAFVSHMLDNETALQSFRNSIRNQKQRSCYKYLNHACCWSQWYDSKTIVTQNAAWPSHGPLVWCTVPWLQKTYQMEQKTQRTLC